MRLTPILLHSNIAHRLDEKGVVRVGDFGLARDVYSHLYYRADKRSQVPVKWSALEVLKDRLCTEKSDVVSNPYSGHMEWCAGRSSVWGAHLTLESVIVTFLSIL